MCNDIWIVIVLLSKQESITVTSDEIEANVHFYRIPNLPLL